jgi:N utilization substance protein B
LVQRPETRARARALQLLYAWELSGRPSLDAVIARVAGMYGRWSRPDDRAAELAQRAVAGAQSLDARLERAAEHWRLERVGLVERSILRLALAELEEQVTPPRVVIDEAVRLAQWFAGAKAPAFVNGVLDAAARELGVV